MSDITDNSATDLVDANPEAIDLAEPAEVEADDVAEAPETVAGDSGEAP